MNSSARLLAEAEALSQAGRIADAEQCCRHALATDPANAEAHATLGLMIARQGRLDEAIVAFRRAIELDPQRVETRFHLELGLGTTALAAGRNEEAAACFRRVVELKPDYAEGYNNLGVALLLCDRPAKAEAWLARAVALEGRYSDAYSNLGAAIEFQGDQASDGIERSLSAYRRAAELVPDAAKVRHNYGMALLRSGNFAAGWQEFEWRLWRDGPRRQFAEPRWNGEPLAGKTILLWEDEGLGDSLQCVRYAPLVKARGARVVVECRSQLAGLFASVPGIDRVVVAGTKLPEFDFQIPLLSLPGVFGTTSTGIPACVPYVFPEAARVEKWKNVLGGNDGHELRVGIAWHGDPAYPRNRHRSIPLEQVAGLAREGVRLFSLQMGAGREQLASMKDRLPITDLAPGIADFRDTAAIMRNLDLVIVSDSAPAHLAGALGVAVWVALAHVADWRWLLGRSDSPWYPTMRLYRQSRPGAWDEVFERIASDLVKFPA